METFGYLAVGVVAVVATAVGARLLWIARRTRGLPERVLGGSLAGITGVGFPIVLLTEQRAVLGPWLTFAADFVGSFVVALGFAGFYVFTWRVFRPDARWAAGLTALGSAAALGATAATVFLAFGIESNSEKYLAVRGWEILLFASAAAGFGWSGVEAFLYHARLRRRLGLGLADPVVTNRVLLWGLTGGLSAVATGVLAGLELASVNHLASPLTLFISAGCGLAASAFLYLAFLPPAWYLRRLAPTGAASPAR